MNKNIRIPSIIIASLLAVFALTSLLACQEPVMVARKKADDQTTGEPASITETPAAELPPFSLTYDGNTAVSLSPFKTLATSARSESGRSLGGYKREDVTSLGAGTLNYFQWVYMDADEDGVLYTFDDADNFGSNQSLSAAVQPEHTYHVLLLGGYKPNAATNPTLLASAYTKFTAKGSNSSVSLWLIPVVVDVKFSGGSDGDRQLGRLAKTVGLDAERTYTLEYFIGSANRGVMHATDDALQQAVNDGLWPLKLATAEVRRDDTWLYKYSKDGETLNVYQHGVLDDVEVPLNDARGTNLAWVTWEDGRIEAMNDLSVNKVNKKTMGRGKYEFRTRRETLLTGAVLFHLEYVPFAVFDDAAWRTVQRPASASALTARPIWVIRNGLADTKQDASIWKDGVTYTAPSGGIAIGVVNPAAPRPDGLFEDNNPWPVAGTDTPEKALEALDKGLAADAGVGYGKYAIRRVESADRPVPSMKLMDGTSVTPPVTSDYTVGDSADNGMTFANMGRLKYPLSITITGPSTSSGTGGSTGSTGSPTGAQPVLALSERGSMFALEKLNVPVTMTMDNVTFQGLSLGHPAYKVHANATFAIDIPANPYNAEDNNAALVYVGQGNSFEMLGHAELTGNWNTVYKRGNVDGIVVGGGGAQVLGGAFRMTGDYTKVHHNYAVNWAGGGIHCGDDVNMWKRDRTKEKVIISGDYAEVSYNAGEQMGGVFAGIGSYFELSGSHAKINWNQGGYAGGVHVGEDGNPQATGVMSGTNAEISHNYGSAPNNSATGGSGGLFVSGATFYMRGGEISGNTCLTVGGVKSHGSFVLEGGTIWGNQGGGVLARTSNSFTMKGGVIYGSDAGSTLENTPHTVRVDGSAAWPAGSRGYVGFDLATATLYTGPFAIPQTALTVRATTP